MTEENQHKGHEPDRPAQAPGPVGESFGRVGVSTLASIMALLISTLALGVSLFEANTARVQQRATAWPFIEVDQSFSSEGYVLSLVNKGVGPARIRTLTYVFEDQEFEAGATFDALINAVMGPERAFGYDIYRMSNPRESVMSAGEVSELFRVPWEADTRLFADRFSASGDIKVCYCSIFNECWTKSLRQAGDPEPLNHCPG